MFLIYPFLFLQVARVMESIMRSGKDGEAEGRNRCRAREKSSESYGSVQKSIREYKEALKPLDESGYILILSNFCIYLGIDQLAELWRASCLSCTILVWKIRKRCLPPLHNPRMVDPKKMEKQKAEIDVAAEKKVKQKAMVQVSVSERVDGSFNTADLLGALEGCERTYRLL